MGSIVKLLHVSKSIGVGGCERNIRTILRYLTAGFDQAWVALQSDNQARSAFDLSGTRVYGLNCELGNIDELIRQENVDAVLLHRAGKGEPVWTQLLRRLASSRVAAIFEYNVFGLPDLTREDRLIDVHFHKSKTSYMQFVDRARRSGYGETHKHRVLYNALDIDNFSRNILSSGERQEARCTFGIGTDELVLLRVGRPDVRKWSDFLLAAAPLIFAKVPNARIVFVGAPESRKRWINAQGWGNRVLFWPNVADDRKLALYYQMADILIHASRRGETFPNTVLEAFTLGLPAVVNATPWRDNSQIEIVDHMVDGIVANTPSDYAEAIEFLNGDRARRLDMGNRAVQKARKYNAHSITQRLGRCIVDTLIEKGRDLSDHPARLENWPTLPTLEELNTYSTEYDRRLTAAWSGHRPVKGGNLASRTYWLLKDVVEVVGYRFGRQSEWV